MINTEIKVDTTIDDVSQIRVERISDGIFGGKKRLIIVKTYHDEIYYLYLKAHDAEKLEIRDCSDDEDSWPTPEIYRGKSIAELEEDQHPDK